MKLQLYKNRIKIALCISWACSIISIFLASLSGIKTIGSGKIAPYNPELAILTATLVGLIWYVYWTYRVAIIPVVENEEKKKEQKINLSTALIVELQWLERTLRNVYVYKGEEWAFDPISYPLLEEVEKNLQVFSKETISNITLFHNRILLFKNSFNEQIKGYHPKYQEKEGMVEWLNETNRVKAFLALEVLNDLVDSLYKEGGAIPNPLKMTSFKEGELPILPQSIFPTEEERNIHEVVNTMSEKI